MILSMFSWAYVSAASNTRHKYSYAPRLFGLLDFIPLVSITMPPRLPRVAVGPSRIARLSIASKSQNICPICSISRALGPTASKGRPLLRLRSRQQSNIANASQSDREASSTPQNTRIDLRDALADLHKQAGNYVDRKSVV